MSNENFQSQDERLIDNLSNQIGEMTLAKSMKRWKRYVEGRGGGSVTTFYLSAPPKYTEKIIAWIATQFSSKEIYHVDVNPSLFSVVDQLTHLEFKMSSDADKTFVVVVVRGFEKYFEGEKSDDRILRCAHDFDQLLVHDSEEWRRKVEVMGKRILVVACIDSSKPTALPALKSALTSDFSVGRVIEIAD